MVEYNITIKGYESGLTAQAVEAIFESEYGDNSTTIVVESTSDSRGK
jgi:hypothetical protein